MNLRGSQQGVCRRIGVALRWLVGLHQEGLECFGVLWIIGCVTIVGCRSILGTLMCFGIEGGRPRLQGCRSQLWGLRGRWRGMVGIR